MINITHTKDVVQQLQEVSYRLEKNSDLDLLIKEIGNARYVLLGEASHGTHEYYTWRAHITKRLIQEKGFTIIGVEGDWPDCYRLNRYIKGYKDAGESAKEVLKAFNRWPTWMWPNWEIVALSEWLRSFNQTPPGANKISFYGLDVYSLWESMEAIFDYLKQKDPDSLKSVQKAMDCFEPFNVREGFTYAERNYGVSASCKQELEAMLSEIRRHMPLYADDHESTFSAEQNALVAVNAERYYQVMLSGGEATWNIRDRHMTETVNRLMNHYGKDAKIIIWEHNTHIGDARATDMQRSGLVNIGQLLKQEHEQDGVYRVGFGSYVGNVLAGYEWGGRMHIMQLPKARQGSWEHLLHDAGNYDKFLLSKNIQNFIAPIGHRAIGVVYDPEYEFGNYVPSIIPVRYEAFVFLDKTTALHALHTQADPMQIPETYPWGV